MSDEGERPAEEVVMERYREYVKARFPGMLAVWPLIGGYNLIGGTFRDWGILIFKHTGSRIQQKDFFGELATELVGAEAISTENLDSVRKALAHSFGLTGRDGVIVFPRAGPLPQSEIEEMALRHYRAISAPLPKIFLSHKGTDKPKVRAFAETLQMLGFEPWLDEDAMSAGTGVHRGIAKGMRESCAVVFFITPSFRDDDYLATEIDLALSQKHEKQVGFSIITLVFPEAGRSPAVPDMLHRFVCKPVRDDLHALREILRALPLAVGAPRLKPNS